ncbi:MAG: cyclic nucleotide-binding domain-containing protein [Magnetococcales bacterium]|nr:cyclic nucleotide-binding domain-containing protein [Magnetococcales bacterium]
MATFINKLKPGKKEVKTAGAEVAAGGNLSQTHPKLEPKQVVALPNVLTPIQISSQGLSCDITYQSDPSSYRVVLKSNKKMVSDEQITPTDRKKKAVTDFMFKGLIGIHFHPSGMLLALDQEENFRGEARTNQPPAVILSAPYPAGEEGVNSQRFANLDLTLCSEENPLLIAPNHGKFHMLVKPVKGESNQWGLYLSNPKGYIREDSPPVLFLEPSKSVIIDRQFFTSRASSGDGGIDARNWNKAIIDPVMVRLVVDEASQLMVEDMFTVSGLTLLLEDGKPIALGAAGIRSAQQDAAHKKQFADMLLAVRKETQDEGNERGMEHALLKDRKRVLAEVRKEIKKVNQDGVSKLALELAVKEVLAPFYGGAGGSDSAMTVSHQTVSLLNAVSGEIVGWIEADTSRALAVSAVEKAIEQSAPLLPRDGLEEVMSLELPSVQANTLGGNNSLFGSLVSNAKKNLTGKKFVRDIRQISKDLQACEDKEQQQQIVQKLDALVRKMVHGVFEKTLVSIAVKGHLIQTEKERREAMGYELKQVIEAPLTSHELENVLKRYDSYALFMDRSFDDRLERPLDALIQDFQHGANDDQERSVSSKPYLTYLIALRASGGKISAKSDNTPAVSSLQSLPDAIPDISVLQPDPAEPRALVRIIHREGVLLESSFNLAPRPLHVPDEVPNGLWFAVEDLSKFIMGYYLTGESAQAKDRRQSQAIIIALTTQILLKIANFFRDYHKMPTSDEWEGIAEVIGRSNLLLETVIGANPEDEFLEMHKRPGHLSEDPLNIKHELRRIIVELEKDGIVDLGSYRFKQRVRSFAVSGAGEGSRVLLPIKMLAKGGVFLIRSKYNDVTFEKSVRLNQDDDEGVTSVLMKSPHEDDFTLQTKKVVTKRLSKAALYKLVHAMPFFSQFSIYEKTKISEYDTSFKLYHKGDIVLRQESQDIAFFVVIKGHVRALKRGSDLTKYGPGEMFGEMAFLTNRPQVMTVETLTNVLVLRVDQEMFAQLGPESREKFKNHIIDRQVRSLAEATNSMQTKSQNWGDEAPKSTTVKPPSHTNIEGEVAKIEREKAVEMIDNLTFFDQFSTFEKRRIIAFFTSFRSYKPNGEIIREGMTDNSFFILIEGEVQVIKGESTIIVSFGPGEFFGEMAFLTNEARTTSVRSKGDVLALRLDSKLIDRLGPEIREKIKDQFITKLTDRLVKTLSLLSQ